MGHREHQIKLTGLNQTTWIRDAIRLGFALLATMLWLSIANAQDTSSMPWVNETSGQPTWIGDFDRPTATTLNRATVPLKRVARRKTSRWNPNWSFADLGYLGRPVVIVLAVLVAAALIGFMVRLVLISKRATPDGDLDDRPRRSLAESIKQLPFQLDVTEGDFHQHALAAYQNGDLKRAIIFLFSHVLVTLDQQRLLHLTKGKTNRQYLRELKPYPNLASYYGDLMVPFEQTFFGDYTVHPDVYDQCLNGLDQFHVNLQAIKAGKASENVT